MPDRSSTFEDAVLETIDTKDMIGIRGGADAHRYLPIWMVTVDGRVFARSWSRRQRSWRTAFAAEGVGMIDTGKTQIAVSGTPITEDALNLRIDDAYRDKYGDHQGVADITRPVSIATTLELCARDDD